MGGSQHGQSDYNSATSLTAHSNQGALDIIIGFATGELVLLGRIHDVEAILHPPLITR